jgi:chlorite dismutase
MSIAEKKSIKIHPFEHGSLEDSIEIIEIQALEDNQEVPENHYCFRILSHKGDERLVWDSRSLVQLNEAKQTFLSLIKKGMTPYHVGIGGKVTSEIMREFNPHAEEVIFVPTRAIVGG